MLRVGTEKGVPHDRLGRDDVVHLELCSYKAEAETPTNVSVDFCMYANRYF